MQTNEITLTVDEDHDGATTADEDYVFTRFETFLTRSLYHLANHLPDFRSLLGFYRTSSKPNGNFRGTQKSSFKFTQDIVVDGVDGVAAITSPIIFEVNASIPLGATSAQILIERQKVSAMMNDDTVMDALNENLAI